MPLPCYNCPHYNTPLHHCEIVEEWFSKELNQKVCFTWKTHYGPPITLKVRDWRKLWFGFKTHQVQNEKMITFKLHTPNDVKEITVTHWEWSNMSAQQLYKLFSEKK